MRCTLSLLSMLVLASCAHAPPTDGPTGSSSGTAVPSTPVAQSRARGVVIATLQTHGRKVSILGRTTGDPSALRVVVRTNDGALVADGLTVAELQRVDPAIYAIVTSALASEGAYLDATLHGRRSADGQGRFDGARTGNAPGLLGQTH